MGEMSDDSVGTGSPEGTGRDGGFPQPASGAMDKATAHWYVDHTQGQFQTFERDGRWYLYTPDSDDGAEPVGAEQPVADSAESAAAER
jgi:hypothetical protein